GMPKFEIRMPNCDSQDRAAHQESRNRGCRGQTRINTNEINWFIRAYPRFCFVISQIETTRGASGRNRTAFDRASQSLRRTTKMRLALGTLGLGRFSLTGFIFAPTVLPLKFLNPAGGIDEFDFSSVEGVADRTDFHVDLWPRAAGRKFVPAPA